MAGITLRDDAWLGERLGRRALHLDLSGVGPGIDAAAVAAALRPLGAEGAVFVDASVDIRRQDLLRACSGAGMLLADTNLRLVRPEASALADRGGRARPAAPADREAVAEIAGASLRLSRFHRDPAIGPGLADRLKAAWAANFFAGQRGDGMVVAEAEGRVAGFLLYLVRRGSLVIDLVAVAEGCRGKGLGCALVREAALRSGAGELVTGTQAVNFDAVRFYENLGFRLCGASHVFHHHGGPA